MTTSVTDLKNTTDYNVVTGGGLIILLQRRRYDKLKT
jgi:hypothetical protein